MKTKRSFHSIVRGLACAVVLPLFGCGDDGGGGGTMGSSSGTGTETEAAVPTTTGGSTSTTDGSTSTTAGTSSSGGSSTMADSGSSGGSESTGTPGDCPAQPDQETCDGMKMCVWVGNPQNGECLSADPDSCPEYDMQQCQQHPACDWDNQGETCGPVQ